jgi:hypothetical protein
MTWLKTQHLPPDEEVLNHAVPIALGGVTNLEVATWLRYGIAQAVQPESVKDIIARYAKHPYWETPAGRPIVQHWMDLEVQAAMADAQRPVRPATVRDAIKGYVDQFINEWLAANPKKP